MRLSKFLAAFLLFSFPMFAEKPMVVLTTSYNNQEWAYKNLDSIFAQDYSNYRVIYIDDASQDGTADVVEEFVKSHPKKLNFLLIRNLERKGALYNIYHAIHDHCEEDEIVVSLDGDDWFYENKVLKKVNVAYSLGREVWLTHGTMIEYPSNTVGWSLPIPRRITLKNLFRTYRCPSHLRTFYAWLFKKINLEDLQYNGQFFSMTWDQAIMFPMIEMAGERHIFIPSLTYAYNMRNPINDYKVDPQLQRDLEAFIRSKPPYARLEHKRQSPSNQ
jgi:glycosyltransferase involved in cell wall biosynthesis